MHLDICSHNYAITLLRSGILNPILLGNNMDAT